jgi:hypothetical protein
MSRNHPETEVDPSEGSLDDASSSSFDEATAASGPELQVDPSEDTQ